MNFAVIEKKMKSEVGAVSVFSLMILVVLTIAGIAAITMSNNETSIVRNEQLGDIEFYNAESGVNDARINISNWLTDDFLTDGQTAAQSTFNSIFTDVGGNPVATVQARCIENNNAGGTVTPIFNNIADEMPAMPHIGPPPPNSGFSVKYFEIRRYSITSTSRNGNTTVQTGVWKVFNKY